MQKIINSNVSISLKDRLRYLINSSEDNCFSKAPQTRISFNDKEINLIIEKHDNISSNILDFARARVVHKIVNNTEENDTNKDIIQYLIMQKLPNQKIILLSATAHEDLYYEYFGKERIKLYDSNQAKYKGKIIQYHTHSFSRSYLDINTDIITTIEEITEDTSIITFKKEKKKFTYYCDLHFGNAEGHNCFEGKDIAIVGTPHLNESVYKLYGAALGIDVNNEHLRYQQIQHGIYKFWFMTYDNPLLRKIQLWLIEQELEQCVGRARILRNDCNVLLFSNFPVKQATLICEKLK